MRNRFSDPLMIRQMALLVCLLMPSLAPAAQEVDLLAQAEAQLDAGRASEAYALLSGYEFDYAGSIAFDRLLGLAAMADGRFTEASLAFERVLIVQPDNSEARFDLGLANLRLGNTQRAREEFDRVLAANPSERLRELVRETMMLIEPKRQAAPGLKTRTNGFVAFSFGFDSNINNSTDDAQTSAFLFGFPVLLFLDADNVEKDDSFTRASAGLSWYRPVSERSQWVTSLQGSWLIPTTETAFGTLDLGGSLAYQWFEGRSRWELGARLANTHLDEEDYLDQVSVWGGWRHSLDNNNLFDLRAHVGQYRYQRSGLSVNDYDRLLLSGRLFHRPLGKTMLATLGLQIGVDDDVNDSANGNERFWAVSAGLTAPVPAANQTMAFVRGSVKKSLYDKTNVAFLEKREDSQLDLRAGVTWQLEDQWSLTADVSHTRVNSTIDIYAYDRTVTALTVKKSFGD